MKAIVLSSGGLDSSTTLAIAKSEGYEVYSLSFDYGQRHGVELDRAREIAHYFGVKEHLVLTVDLRSIGGSALTGQGKIPKNRTHEEMGTGIPETYVPARNTIFLSFALAWAEVIAAQAIFIGINALDYSGYPDCRPEYIRAFEQLARLGTKAGVEGRLDLKIHAPLIQMTKARIIQRGQALGVPFHLTHSCYDPTPEGAACGRCDSCLLRKKGFEEAGIADPAVYVK